MDVNSIPSSAKEILDKNTIPVARALEKQIHASISRDQDRLRVLVGGNYRDLLSTAEEIVVLSVRAKDAETKISSLSQQCKPPPSASVSPSISSFRSTSAQLRLLIQCIACASTAWQGQHVLLCAKLIVIPRLLLKSLSGQKSPPKSLNDLQKKTATLRRRLLRLVRSQLTHPASTVEVLVQAICAYCLVTSASSSDAVEYFRNIRLDKMRQRIENGSPSRPRVIEDFCYLVSSVQLLKSLLGRSVNDALTTLQKQPILQDQAITRLEMLDIDGLRGMISDDIIDFTPYIKRMLLTQDEIQRTSSAWVKNACSTYTKGLQLVMARTRSVMDVFNIRKELCSIILPVYFSTPAKELILQIIRQTTNDRVLELCNAQMSGLGIIGQQIVDSTSREEEKKSIWNASLSQSTLNTDSTSYVRRLQSTHRGIESVLSTSVIRKLKRWAKQIGQLQDQFHAVESTRWREMLEEPDDDEDELAMEIVTQLSKQDPEYCQKAMESALRASMNQFSETLQTAVSDACHTEEETNSLDRLAIIGQVVYLIRSLRESSAILNRTIRSVSFDAESKVSRLYEALSSYVTSEIVQNLLSQACPTPGTSTSYLDDLPSPPTFRLLRDICDLLAQVGGTDIWSSAALSNLKSKLRPALLDPDRKNYSTYVTSDFDKYYLKAALSRNGDDDVKAELKQGRLTSSANSTDSASVKARAYWQRTRLLFGILS